MEINQSLYSYKNKHKKTLANRLYKLDKNLTSLKGNSAKLTALLTKNRIKYSASYQFAKLKGKLPMPVRGEFKIIKTNKNTETLYIQSANKQVFAIANGRVVFAGELQSLGQVVVVAHGDNYFSIYGQLYNIKVKENTKVKSGQMVALVGKKNTPLSFMIRKQNKIINPKNWLVAFNK